MEKLTTHNLQLTIGDKSDTKKTRRVPRLFVSILRSADKQGGLTLPKERDLPEGRGGRERVPGRGSSGFDSRRPVQGPYVADRLVRRTRNGTGKVRKCRIRSEK